MASTAADIKRAVASQLGKTDATTPNAIRDQKVNDARREFYRFRAWNFLKKRATLSFTLGSASFPSDFGLLSDPSSVSVQSGTDRTEYLAVLPDQVAQYAVTDRPVYAVDQQNSAILSNRSVPALITYTAVPADLPLDGSGDGAFEPAPDITPVVLLAVALYWLAAERDEDNHDRFMARYKESVARLAARDSRQGPRKQVPHSLAGYDMGFNRP